MKNKKGITLVALIITIIVMLILAGVSINIVVGGDFFGKAEKANELNENMISQAEKDEEDALKQGWNQFTVDEEVKLEGIETYEYIENETVNMGEGVSYQINRLSKIEYSLSKYIEERNGSATVYFKTNSNKQNLQYKVNGEDVSEINEFYDESGNGNIKLSTNSSEEGFIKTNTLVKVENLTKEQLNGLTVEAKSGSEKLTVTFCLNYDETKITYIPTNKQVNINPNFENEKIQIKWDEKIKILGDLHKVETDYATITEKTDITKSEINMNTKNSYSITPFDTSTIPDTVGVEKIYLVQEIGDEEKTVYMDDYKIEFYNPIQRVELASPKVLQYVTSEADIKPRYIGYNDAIPDVINTTVVIKENAELFNLKEKIKEAENKDFQGEPEEKEEKEEFEKNKNMAKLIKNNQFSIYDGNKIKSDIEGSNLSALLAVLGKNTFIQDIIKVQINATDYGEDEVEVIDDITVAVGNFMIFAIDDASAENISLSATPNIQQISQTEPKDELSEALATANTLMNTYDNVVIRQMISNYDVDEYTVVNEKNPINDLIETKKYLDIEVPNGKKLIYDINSNTLNFEEKAKLRIGENSNFTLMSSKKMDTNQYGYTYHKNGKMTFSHGNTFSGKVEIKTYSWENFISVERYKNLKSLKTFIASLGEATTGLEYVWNCVKYNPLYTTTLMNSYKEYINSFNNIGLQNKDYKHNMEAIINNGTFNFHSGSIELVTEETVTAIGAFGGGVVINVADSFLKILNEFNITVPNLTDYAASFAKLENTAVGVKNNKDVVLGTGQGSDNDKKPYPEIVVVVDSAVNGIGLSVGSLTNPNRVVSRAYGVWNAVSTAKTTMNSGFIQMAITNNTNNWVSLNVGRNYGIFNDHGTTILNGFTTVPVTRDISIYGVITEQMLKKKDTETDSKIINAINEAYNNFASEMDKMIHNVQTKNFEGFFSFAELQILYKLTGGGTTCYTNSYAVANAEGRPVYKNKANYNEKLGDADGIIFGEKFGLVEKEFEGTIDNIFNKSQSTEYKIKIPGYYVLYEDNNRNGEYNPGPGGPDIDHDYHNNTFQKISNPINHYLNLDTVFGTAFSKGTEIINNLINTSWIGEDFKDENIIYNLIKLTVKGATNWAKEIIIGI